MKNILFNKNDYFQLPVQIRQLYENIGDDVFALKTSSFKIDVRSLPQWLSVNQYTANKRLIGNYYNLTTRGFNSGIVKLMQLNYNVARGIKTDYVSVPVPNGTVISEETFYKLPANDKVKYTRIEREGKTIYVTKGKTSVNIPSISQTPVRPPTIGVKQIPIGRWVEVK